jgi:hypothetical protein
MQSEPLQLYTITATVDRYTTSGDQDGPTGPPVKDRIEHTVNYVAPSQTLALAYFHEVWDIRKPEIHSTQVTWIDCLIWVDRGRT